MNPHHPQNAKVLPRLELIQPPHLTSHWALVWSICCLHRSIASAALGPQGNGQLGRRADHGNQRAPDRPAHQTKSTSAPSKTYDAPRGHLRCGRTFERVISRMPCSSATEWHRHGALLHFQACMLPPGTKLSTDLFPDHKLSQKGKKKHGTWHLNLLQYQPANAVTCPPRPAPRARTVHHTHTRTLFWPCLVLEPKVTGDRESALLCVGRVNF